MSTLSPIEETEKTGKLVTMLVSIFFGIIGLIPAFIYKGQLEQASRPAGPIWKSFWIGIAINLAIQVICWVLYLVLVVSLVTSSR